MLIPIGHEQETVRRLPWVTIAIIVANIVLFVTVGLQGSRAEKLLAERLARVFEYWSAHPYLSVPAALTSEHLSPRDREQLKMMREAFKHTAPDDPAQVRAEQGELDRLAREAFAARDEHPFWDWGLIPRHPRPSAFLKAMFMHAGWLHLLSNMFLLYLAGPAVEDAYGRPLYAGLYLGGGILANLAHVVAFPASEVPLVGASGAIAVIMGAFMVRYARSRIKFFYWFAFVFHGTFEAPAWFMLGLWLLQQLFYASLTAEGGAGVAYIAHAGGFTFGVAAALLIKHFRVEERYIHPAIEKQISLSQHPALDEGMELLARGDLVAAREALGRALADEPRNPDVHLALWETFVAEGNAAAGAAHFVQVIEQNVKDGELGLAFDRWRELARATGRGGPAVLRWRLAAGLGESTPEAEVELLESLARDPGAELLQEKAQKRLEVLGRTVKLETATPSAPASSPEQGFPAPAVVASGGGVLDEDTSPAFLPPVMPSGLAVEMACPETQQPDGILLRGGVVGTELAPYATIEAVSVVGISGGEKPYLLVDLIVPDEAGAGHRALRLTSSSFDPRQVTGRPDLPPMAALRHMLVEIVRGSGAKVLAGDEGLAGGKFPIFESIDDYEKHILSSYN